MDSIGGGAGTLVISHVHYTWSVRTQGFGKDVSRELYTSGSEKKVLSRGHLG